MERRICSDFVGPRTPNVALIAKYSKMIKKSESPLKATNFWKRLPHGSEIHSEELISRQQKGILTCNFSLLHSPTIKSTCHSLRHLSYSYPFIFPVRKPLHAFNSALDVLRPSTNHSDRPTANQIPGNPLRPAPQFFAPLALDW